MMTSKTLIKICEEPYRLFFPLGILAGLLGVSHWLLYSLGLISQYSPVFHSSIQVQLFVTFFIVGFLMTAGPRFAGAAPATGTEVAGFLLIFLVLFIALILQHCIFSDILFCLLLLRLALFLSQRMLKGAYRPPAEFVWIPIGVLCGILGAVFSVIARMNLAPPALLVAGKVMKEQGFVLSVVLGVGGFLGPRLLGFSGLLNPSQLRSMADAQKMRSRRIMIHLAAGICILMSFYFEGAGHLRLAYGLRAIIVTAEFFWTTAIYRLPAVSELFAWLLWHALWFVCIGYWACTLWPLQRKGMLHIVFIGGFSLLIIAVATMVIFSHAGEGAKLKKPLWTLRFAAIGVFLALLIRVMAAFFPVYYFTYLAIAAMLWIAASIAWLCLMAPRLMRRVHTESDQC